jgi:hypothetical protein
MGRMSDMGRGSMYQYEHFMLIDDEKVFYMDNGEWDTMAYMDFIDEVSKAFKADKLNEMTYVDREAYVFAETDRLEIGIDNGGGYPALFLLPKEYETSSGRVKQYVINADAKRGFTKLIKMYPGVFRYPTSAWTSEPYRGEYSA